jgi:uncharacterized RDD family membrane protein YckC
MDRPAEQPAGVRLGLPAEGRGSVAGWGRRFLGVLVDWVIASLIARAFLTSLGAQFGPLLVFFVMHLLLVSTIGMTIGHAVVGIVVRRLDGRPVGFVAGSARALLLSIVIPAVITAQEARPRTDRDGRATTGFLRGAGASAWISGLAWPGGPGGRASGRCPWAPGDGCRRGP